MQPTSTTTDRLVGSPQLLRRVRGGFVMKGTTLAAWARSNGHSWSYARKCLVGERSGPSAERLISQALRDSGVTS